MTLRARDSREVLAGKLARLGITTEPARSARQALHITSSRPNILLLQHRLPGEFEVQDEGSQLIGEAVQAGPGDEVLDLCAGAGGKSLQLAATGARVYAADVDLAKLERLRTRASRAGADVLICGRAPPEGRKFSRVLVDAPCSELGTLRRSPDFRWHAREEDIAAWAAVQRALVGTALTHLQPGGRLVYATCTWTQEENEGVVEAVLAEHSTLRLVETRLLTPHEHGTDGFFIAVLSA